ncbi:hypothetical protein FE257_004613 [Aspergillus nanangensis]|uniref:DUF7702 domain-containing protein n=1 Tax=Aspergillus nanangensis TaxID=2582783 RepID=A0AAD4GYK1_ASPNN|nr:hypothetical protein FE257_004613 [Aspergillus nanangensis]
MPPTYTIPLSKQHLAITELILFSLIQLIQFPTRYTQEWRYWHHRKRKSSPRCFFYSWCGMIGLLAQLRIASSALILSDSHPNQSKLITENVLQTIGLSPLLFEMSLVLLRSGQTNRFGPNTSRYPKPTRLALHFFRFPVFIGIVLSIVGATVGIRACSIVGSVMLVLAFVFASCLAAWLAVCYWGVLPRGGRRCVVLVLCAVPFYAVRIAYALVAQYGGVRFSPEFGDVGARAAMGVLMEVIIVGLLFAARAAAEPFWGKMNVNAQ